MRASAILSSVVVLGVLGTSAACNGNHANPTGTGGTGAVEASGGSTSSAQSTSTSGSGAGGGDTASGFPFPPVVDQGGPLVTAPKVVTITFAGDPLAQDVDAFGTSVLSSAYWKGATAGLCGTGNTCVGAGTGTSVSVSQTPAASYTDSLVGGASTMQPFLQGIIAGLDASEQPDDDTIYVFYFPATTTILLDGSESCGFGSYHGTLTVGAHAVTYAVIPECPLGTHSTGLTLAGQTTYDATVGLLGSATDTTNTKGYYLDTKNPATWGWEDLVGGEIGDLCFDLLEVGQDLTTEDGFTVPRIWSIEAASAGKNPCLPIPGGEVYFNAFPTKSLVTVEVGQSQAFEVDALANGPMPNGWTLTVLDVTDPTLQTPYLSFSLAGGASQNGTAVTTVASGDKTELTVQMLADPGGSVRKEGLAILFSTNGPLEQATKGHWWPLVVMTSAEASHAMQHQVARPRRRGPAMDLAKLLPGRLR